MSHFVSTQWLAEHLDDPQVVVLDASWYMPHQKRDPHGDYLKGHIPGAVFFDIDGIADTSTALPHMLPSPDQFAAQVGALGISDTMTIVIYDEVGLLSAPRAWWTFRTMGAKDVRILEGGGPKWRGESRPTEGGPVERAPQVFTPSFDPEGVRSFDQVKASLGRADLTIVDARPTERFQGEVAEPRAGLKSGHIPGSRSVPVGSVSENGVLKSPQALREIFTQAGVDLDKPVITTCGSGITASTLALALDSIGAKQVAVYDGSWTEWGSREDAPVEK